MGTHLILTLSFHLHVRLFPAAMEYHKSLDLLRLAEEPVWVDKINGARLDGRLCAWVTTLNLGQSSCELTGGFANGSYNVCLGFRFNDGSILVLRLPRASSTSPDYADEKVALEVDALNLFDRQRTQSRISMVTSLLQ